MKKEYNTKEEILDLILKIAYPNQQEREKIDKPKLLIYWSMFADYIEYCQKGEDFLNCMKEWKGDFLDMIIDITEVE